MPVKRSTLRDQPSIVRKPALRMQMNSRKFHCPFFPLFSLFSSLESPYPSSRRVGNLPRGGGGGGDAQGRARRLEYLVERWPSRELLAFYRKRKRASCKRILFNITELHCPPRLSEKKKRGGDAREPRAMAGISRPDYISPARTPLVASRFQIIRIGLAPFRNFLTASSYHPPTVNSSILFSSTRRSVGETWPSKGDRSRLLPECSLVKRNVAVAREEEKRWRIVRGTCPRSCIDAKGQLIYETCIDRQARIQRGYIEGIERAS